MTIVTRFAVATLLAFALFPISARAVPPPERIAILRRGINITGWFRFPTTRDPAALRDWLSDAAMADLRRADFTFVRLAIDPAIIDGPPIRAALVDQVRRLQRHGLAVILSPHPVTWNLDESPEDRTRLVAFWRDLVRSLRGLAPALTIPEVLNEPVFHASPAEWWDLQNDLHDVIRAALPKATIILTGHDWGSIAGLLALKPNPDGNVIYSFHFYDPAELTSLAAYRAGLDRAALARLPFPGSDPARCLPVAKSTDDSATRDLIQFYCTTGWDASRVRARLADAISWARGNGAALLAGEFGASAALNSAARLAWLGLVRETCAENGIGWALWGYDDVMGLAVSRPPSRRPTLDRAVLNSLGLRVP